MHTNIRSCKHTVKWIAKNVLAGKPSMSGNAATLFATFRNLSQTTTVPNECARILMIIVLNVYLRCVPTHKYTLGPMISQDHTYENSSLDATSIARSR